MIACSCDHVRLVLQVSFMNDADVELFAANAAPIVLKLPDFYHTRWRT